MIHKDFLILVCGSLNFGSRDDVTEMRKKANQHTVEGLRLSVTGCRSAESVRYGAGQVQRPGRVIKGT